MKSLFRQLVHNSFGQIIFNLCLISLGSILCAIAINGVLIPNKFFSAGIMGLVLMIHYMIPSLPVSVLYILLNIPIFTLGWRYVGRRFFLYSAAGMFIFSGAVYWIHIPLSVQDMLPCSILAGIITGAGSGIIMKSIGSAGGTDILSVALLKRFSIRLGNTSLAFNSLVLLAAGLFFPLEKVLYTLIYIYVSTRILDLLITGLSQRKAVMVISSQWREISRTVLNEIHRGATIWHGTGAYTGQKENILYTVVNFRELSHLKKMIRSIDPKAFVVVSNTMEVLGHRIGNQPQW